jgi:hypothetical protein
MEDNYIQFPSELSDSPPIGHSVPPSLAQVDNNLVHGSITGNMEPPATAFFDGSSTASIHADLLSQSTGMMPALTNFQEETSPMVAMSTHSIEISRHPQYSQQLNASSQPFPLAGPNIIPPLEEAGRVVHGSHYLYFQGPPAFHAPPSAQVQMVSYSPIIRHTILISQLELTISHFQPPECRSSSNCTRLSSPFHEWRSTRTEPGLSDHSPPNFSKWI